MGFLPVGYYEDHSTIQGTDDRERTGNKIISGRSELVSLKCFTANMKVSKSLEEKMKLVHRGYDQFRMAFTGAAMRDLS